MANSTKKAPSDDGKSYISQLETVGSGAACAATLPRHEAAARSSEGKSARATGPAALSRATGPEFGRELDRELGSTGTPSAGNAIRIAVSNDSTEKVTECARKTTSADAASASIARGRGRAPSRATIPNHTRAGGSEST